MLPSQGLFRSLPCPFFVAGLCERPHCTFRHCKSDIRIDRKLEADLSDEPVAGTSADTPQSSDNETPMSQSSNDSSQTLSKAPVNTTAVSVLSSISKESLSSLSSSASQPLSSQSQSESLNSPSSSTSTNQRKRSKDSESSSTTGADVKKEDPNKRRRVLSTTSEKGEGGATADALSDVMGDIASKVKGFHVDSTANTPTSSQSPPGTSKSRKGKREAEEDINKLVAEIEKAGKSPSSSSSSDKKRSGHRQSTSSSSSHKHSKKDEQSSKSGSHRKENKSSKEETSGHGHRSSHRKSSESSKKEHSTSSSGGGGKSSRKESSDSVASGSISSSKESSRKDGKSSGSSRHSSSADKKRDKDKERERGADKDKDKKKGIPLSRQASVDTMNRFNVFQTESTSASDEQDESAYNSDVFDDSFDNFKYPGGGGTDSDEDDPEMVARECLEMFENYKPESPPPPMQPPVKGDEKKGGGGGDEDEGFCVVGGGGKKRVAHGNIVPTVRAPHVRTQAPVTSRNLQGQLLKRFEDQSLKSPRVQGVQKLDERINGSPGVNFPKLPKPSAPPPQPQMKVRRIAHVPNAGLLAQKPVIGGGGVVVGQNQQALSGPLTYSQTAAKGVKREAHKPSAAVVTKKSPVIFRDAINKTTKIPHATRQQIMDKMFAEYCRLEDDHDKAFEMAVMREHELIQKCTSKQVYYSSGISIISGMRKLSKEEGGGGGGMIGGNRVVSHEMILSGGGLAARNCSVRTVRREGGPLVGNGLYKGLRKYVLTEVQLVENGYPRPHPTGEPGRALAKPRMSQEMEVTSLTDRTCDRCKKRYFTTEDGEHLVKEVCNYHWGRKFNMAGRGGRGARESNYVCCGSDDDRMGCATSVCHVSKCPVPISNQKGFVEAVLEEGPEDRMGEDPWDIIGIDCEMVYTTHGNELARVTVVAADSKVLYDEIVKPTHRVLDCNTRFSGITFDDLDKARRTITEVQAILLARLRPNTILIGHSLESDLIALRLKHECVIDTSVLYPHKMGPPKKRALKTLSVEILKKVIQESDGGHDSAEDAQIAVELVMAKLKFDTTK